MNTRQRLAVLEEEFDRRQYADMMPQFIIVSFEQKFHRYYQSRHNSTGSPPKGMIEQYNRGEKLWLGLYRVIFLPDRYKEPHYRFEGVIADFKEALHPFVETFSTCNYEKSELRIKPVMTHLSHGCKTWKEQRQANEKLNETAKKYNVKM